MPAPDQTTIITMKEINMLTSAKNCVFAASILLGVATHALAQPADNAPPHPSSTVTAAAPGGDGEGAQPSGKLVLLFPTGSATLDAHHDELLDKAGRLYRDGHPIIMIVSGSADAVGAPAGNLVLSMRRSLAVANGLMARGIPAERTQLLAKGETNPAVQEQRGMPEALNRRVEITWR